MRRWGGGVLPDVHEEEEGWEGAEEGLRTSDEGQLQVVDRQRENERKHTTKPKLAPLLGLRSGS